jgi:hypothetical protein
LSVFLFCFPVTFATGILSYHVQSTNTTGNLNQ